MDVVTDRVSFEVPADVLQSLTLESQAVATRLLNHKAEASDLSVQNSFLFEMIYLRDEQACCCPSASVREERTNTCPPHNPFKEAPFTSWPVLPFQAGSATTRTQTIIATAFREANEEVGLPQNLASVYVLCVLRPFISQYRLIVTPVVAFLTDLSILDTLTPCEDEVDAIFEHPLEAVLDPSLAIDMPLVEKGSDNWPYDDDLHSVSDTQGLSGTSYRMHRFRSVASPVKGLTSDILILAAEIAFNRAPIYDRWAPGQVDSFAGIARILEGHEGILKRTKHPSQEHLPAA
ncbi:hypothetical protein DFH11DRAFT_1740887 [Phellopilus nigrolimitatus]|nr:hypothetical protein DFH11DRAFT_1740887 [Phellopilus nigrolimitatus]